MTSGNADKLTKGHYNIVVLGPQGVGKTAMVVRFLTKRFLTEYAHSEDTTYTRSVSLDEKIIPIKVVDVLGTETDQIVSIRDKIHKADGLLVAYSVTDTDSFEKSLDILDLIKAETKNTSPLPVVLVGTKTDLGHLRKVDPSTVQQEMWNYLNTSHLECSAATQTAEVDTIFQTLIKQIIIRKEANKTPKQRRKVSVTPLGSPKLIRAHIKRRFSVFSRDRNGTM